MNGLYHFLPASGGYVRTFRSHSYSRSTDCQLCTSMEAKAILSGRNKDLILQEALNLQQNAVKNPELVSYAMSLQSSLKLVIFLCTHLEKTYIRLVSQFPHTIWGYSISKLNGLPLIFFRWLEMWSIQMVPKRCQATTEKESSCAQTVLHVCHSR